MVAFKNCSKSAKPQPAAAIDQHASRSGPCYDPAIEGCCERVASGTIWCGARSFGAGGGAVDDEGSAVVTAMTTDPRTPRMPIPQGIRVGLARVEARLKAISVTKAFGSLGLVLSTGAAAGMLLDFAFALPVVLRWLIWLAWAGLGCWLWVVAICGRLVRPMSWLDLAAVAEAEHPDLHERLTSTVDLLSGPTHGSPRLIEALAEQAALQSGSLDLGRSLSFRAAKLRFALGVGALLVVLAPSVVRPDPFRQVLKRFLMPWAGINRVGRFIIAVTPGSRVVALGSDVSLSALIRPRFGSAEAPTESWLEWTDERTGKHHRTIMSADSDDAVPERNFTVTVPRVADSFRYQVASSGVVSSRFAITAIAPPAHTNLTFDLQPPGYTKLPKTTLRAPTRVDAWEGSAISIALSTNRPMEKVVLDWPIESAGKESSQDHQSVPLTSNAEGTSWKTTLNVNAAGTFALRLLDRHGLTNAPEPTRRIVVKRDAIPTVAFVDEKPALESRSDDMLVAEIDARDDVGVALLAWQYTIQRSRSAGIHDEGERPIQLPALGSRRARGEVTLDLKELNLRARDVLAYRVKVVDNKPGPNGPNVGWSDSRLLSIVDKAEPMLERKVAAERSDLQAQLDALKKLAATNRQATEQLRYAADAIARGNGTWDELRDQELKDREAGAKEIIARLETFARAVDDHPQYSQLARPARQIARVEADGSRETLSRARRATDATQRLAELRLADGRLAAVQTRLDELQRLFDEVSRLEEDRRKLQNLAQRQENLAHRTARLADDPANRGGDRARLDQIRNEQDRLARELNELTRNSPNLKGEILAAKAREAAELAQKARDLAQHERAEARKTAEINRDDPRLRALLEAQRALEDDARRLAMEVDAPLAENGRGRLNAEALRRAEEPLERGDIAQGRQALEQGEDELRRFACDLEDVGDDPKALARRLARRQEQLRDQVRETVHAHVQDRNKPSDDEKRRVKNALKPLAAREAAIAGLAARVPVQENQRALVQNAEGATRKAQENLEQTTVKETEERQNQAVDALHRLANELPEIHQRRDQTRQKLAQARAAAEEVAREIERHLRETAPQAARAQDADAAAAELAKRLAALATRQQNVAETVAMLEVENRARPQQARAARRAQRLADALNGIRAQSPRDSQLESSARAVPDWRVIGPFALDAKPPAPVDGPIDLKSIHVGRGGAKVAWKPVRSQAPNGVVNLGEIYDRNDGQSAFGHAEITSAVKGKARLVVGSDDSLVVWLNGRQVYEFKGDRSYAPEQAIIDVDVVEGANRLYVKCGNRNGEWLYSVGLRLPFGAAEPERPPNPRLVRELRQELPALQVEERAALDRLDQKLSGRAPADDLAEQLALEAKSVAERREGEARDDPAERVDDQKRIATAVRALNVPDARLLQTQAIRATERAARAVTDAKPAKRKAAQQDAGRAIDELARRLTDSLAEREQAAALARAQRALDATDAPHDASAIANSQQAIADEAARLHQAGHEAAAQLTEQAARMAERTARGDQGDPTTPPPTALAMRQTREKAAAALEAMAQAAGPDAKPTDPAPTPSHKAQAPSVPKDNDLAINDLAINEQQAAGARDLAQRERRIRERLQAMLSERIAPQEKLRDETAALGRELADLRDQTRDLSPRSHGPANAAADLLQNHAPQIMSQGAEHMAQARVSEARDDQRRAAETIERAAQQAEDAATALRADRPANAGEPRGDLAAARRAQRAAGQQLAQARDPQLGAEAAQAASGSMHQAADGMRAAAQRHGRGQPGSEQGEGQGEQMAGREPGEGKPNEAGAEPRSGPGGTAAPDLAELQALVRAQTGRKWGELPGHLRSEILQMSQGRYRDDYARLIRLYFREIAAESTGAGNRP
jgi:hypothetical protein